MLNKTIRSVLSLAVAFCLVLGMSGNAIALAVSNPVAGTIDQIDNKVNTTIADLEAMIADLEKEVATQEQNLADAQNKLETGKADLADAQVTLDEKKELLDEARAELDNLQGKLDEADEMLGKLEDKAAEYQKQLDDAQAQLDDAQAQLDDAQKQLDDAQKQLGDALVKLNDANSQLNEKFSLLNEKQDEKDDAQAQLDELKDQLAEYDLMTIEEIIDMVSAEMMGEGEAHPFYTIVTVSAEVQASGYYCAVDETWTRPTLGLKVDLTVVPGTVVLIYGRFAMGGPGVGDYFEGVVLQTWSAEEAPTATNIAKAQEKLDAAQAKLDDANAQLNDAKAELDKAGKQLDDAQALLNEKQAEKDAYQTEKDAAQAQKDAYQAKLDDALVQLADAQAQVAWAKGEYQKLYDTIDEIEGTINNYQAKVDEANDAVVKAEEALPKAEVALVEAKEALADAKALVEDIKATYATLHNAVTNPEVSVDFVRETVSTLNEQVNALWASMLTLQTSLHELIAAYEELEGFAIDPIAIEDYYFAGLVIEAFEVGEYHYEEANFHFAGYKFDGYTVNPVTVEGYTFEGFTAPEMPAQLTEISNTLDNVIAKVTTLNAALDYYVAAAKPYLAKALDVTEEALGITYNFLKNNLNKEGAVKVYNWLYNNPDKVCNLVKKFGLYGLDLLAKYGPYAVDLLENHADLVTMGLKLTAGGAYLTATLGAGVLGYVGDHLAFLADYEDEVKDVVRKLYAKYGDEAKALVEVYVDYLNLRERYYNATHADYTIFHDSLYVAIGDSATAVSGSYVDELAELLEIPHMTENLGELDLTVEEAINLVKENADLIGKADLITLNFTNVLASTDMLSALAQDYDNDFTNAVNNTVSKGIDKVLAELKERMVAYGVADEHVNLVDRAGELVDRALAELNERLIAQGLDEATVNMVNAAAEAYAAAYITRAAWYPALVDAVHEVNPDAQIIIVGTYNDLEGVVVEVGNRNIEIGEIAKCLVAVANLENLVQAFIGDEAIYVHASAVETVFEANDYDNLNNLGYLMSILNDEMLPSEAGHAYIAEEIFEALNVEYKILGDVNGDRKVNCRDARLILQYTAGLITEDDLDLTWADVNGDGKVNSRDARLILQLRSGLIEHFPVCRLYEE